jgi:hypothetical protein
MLDRFRRLRLAAALVAAVLVAVALAACGSSSNSGNAKTLLRQTFSGSHTVNSGNLSFALTVTPSGSSTLKGPITLSFGGPFQSLGKGKLPKSNFNVSISALGHTGTLGILSTGTSGYVMLQGTSYQLPTATFQRLESSFAQLGGGSGTGALGKLGIDPMHWLINPTVAGSDSVGGADTTHIRAGVNVSALLADINTFLGKASKLGVSGAGAVPQGLSQSTMSEIASKVHNPTVDVWTGNGDKTLRKLSIGLSIPVSGQLATVVGSSAAIGLTMQYANLNQPETITAPTNVAPYSQFTTKIQAILQAVQSSIVSAVSGGSAGSGGSTTPGTSTTVDAYSQCIQAAGNDVSKMQKCAGLLKSK